MQSFLRQYALLYFLLMNIISFVLFGIDKYAAKTGRWRIRERVLLLFAVFGGAGGALMGMYVFHHKTKKNPFRYLVPLLFLLYLFIWGLLLL
ncbi:MAG: DUF1294 domain-containing protein [Christensenellaceae bacterium]|jgi:uncharacterized membrane protein YsdA (DUF1294 family)